MTKKENQRTALTIGFSPCPNDTFIFDALVHQKINTEGLTFTVYMEDVEALNLRAIRGELDISKVSFAAYPRFMDQYQFLNAGSALGKGLGPLLICGGEWTRGKSEAEMLSVCRKEITNWTIAIPGEHTTANFLFSLFFPEAKKKKEMIFSAIESAVLSGNAQAGVIIHENRFTYAQKGLRKICDLGTLWEEKTGYPIPLGGIAIKKNFSEETRRKLDRVLKRSVEFAFANPASGMDYISTHASEMEEQVMKQHIETYVNEYTIDLGDDGRKAIQAMYQIAVQAGIISKLPADLFVNHHEEIAKG